MLNGAVMRRLTTVLQLAAIAGGVCSCTNSDDDEPAAVDYSTLDSGTYHQELSINPDGSAIRTPLSGTRETFTLSAAQLDDLDREVQAAGFKTLESSYPPDPACDTRVFARIGVVVEDHHVAVEVSQCSLGAPEHLKNVLNILEPLAHPPVFLVLNATRHGGGR
jgi:hypothetical protein